MSARFAGKVAIVTGAARGIGAAIAGRLAREGAKVVVADLDLAAAKATARNLGDGQAIGLACDVSQEAQVEYCVSVTVAKFGGLNVIVNNAGLMTFSSVADWTAQEWMRLLQVDLIGAAMFTREAFRHMGKEGGAIVNIASVHAVQTSPDAGAYAAAKAGLLSLTRTTSIEGRARKIRANAVLPGAVDTTMLWANPNVKSGAEAVDPQDVGAPEDIAGAVAFLASDDARFISGTTLVADGGRLAKL